MTSESTRFLGQPNETKPTVGAVGWEDLLTVLLYRECGFGATRYRSGAERGREAESNGVSHWVNYAVAPSAFNVLFNPVHLGRASSRSGTCTWIGYRNLHRRALLTATKSGRCSSPE